MGRYSINVNYAQRPDYSQQIGSALQAWQQRQDADRAEQNTIAAQGGTPVGEAPPSRLSRIGGFIRRKVLGQGDGTSAEDVAANQPPQSGTQVSPIARAVPASPAAGPAGQPSPAPYGVTQMGGASQLGGALPQTPPQRIGDALTPEAIRRSTLSLMPGSPQGQHPAWDEQVPMVRSGAGNQPSPPAAANSPAAGSIGEALHPYTYTARGGQKYSVDPLYAQRIAAAGHGLETAADIAAKTADQDKTRNEQIQALVDAGMSPAVARAKVLNNVVRYDETFGQGKTGGRAGAMTQAQRLELQDRLDKRQERMIAAQRELQTNRNLSAERRAQLTASLRQDTEDEANDRTLLTADEAAAGRAAGNVTKLQTNPIVAATPAGQQATTKAQADAATAQARADSSRARLMGHTARPRGAPRVPVATRDSALKAQGLNAAQRRAKLRAEGYDVQ